MAGSYFKIEDERDAEIQLNALPGWLKIAALPFLLAVILGLPLAMSFIPFAQSEIIEVMLIPSDPAITIRTHRLVDKSPHSVGGKKVAQGDQIGFGASGAPILSPIAGTLYLNFDRDSLGFNAVIEPEDCAFTIRGKILANRAGELCAGQRVQINLNDYPGAVFGYVECELQGISEIPVDGQYILDIKPPVCNCTDKNNHIRSGFVLTGEGKVYTSETSTLRRVIESITRRLN